MRPTHREATCVGCGCTFQAPIKKGGYVRHCESCWTTEVQRREERRRELRRKRPGGDKRANLAATLRRRGLTLEWWDRTWLEQGEACGICRRTVTSGRNWHIDHDHSCCEKGCPACVRGILCHGCNLGLGNFEDDQDRLLAAVSWLTNGSRRARA